MLKFHCCQGCLQDKKKKCSLRVTWGLTICNIMMFFGSEGVVEEYPPDIWASGNVGLIQTKRVTASQPWFPYGFCHRIFSVVNKREEMLPSFHRHHLLSPTLPSTVTSVTVGKMLLCWEMWTEASVFQVFTGQGKQPSTSCLKRIFQWLQSFLFSRPSLYL